MGLDGLGDKPANPRPVALQVVIDLIAESVCEGWENFKEDVWLHEMKRLCFEGRL